MLEPFMSSTLSLLDAKDAFYAVIGFGLLFLTLQPALTKHRFVNIPLFFVILGAVLVALGSPVIDPRANALFNKVVEHASELIVIISLAGAGLAIDTKGTWRNWNASFRLLLFAMPLTILAIFWSGNWLLGLPVASAMLLAAALAPTDPVLARSVQVSPPGNEETPMQVSLTAEAGLNDGLAFPFVYLAISIATYGLAADGGIPPWFWEWFGWDFIYRVAAGLVLGAGIGWALTKLATSSVGDAHTGRWNSIIMILAATFISYGVTEAVDGYGFLAVFAATRAGRAVTRGTEDEKYHKFVHHGADQLESILLVVLLIWFGMFAAAGGLAGLTVMELLFALALIFVIRPVAGLISMIGYECPNAERFKVAFFGVRGMGSVFYIAYAQSHADFGDVDGVWRVAGLVIALSILVHGFASNFVVHGAGGEDDDPEEHPHAKTKEGNPEHIEI